MTGPVGGIEDFVIKDGEIERQPQPDGVGGLHLGFGYVKCLLVGSFAVLGDGWKKRESKVRIVIGTGMEREKRCEQRCGGGGSYEHSIEVALHKNPMANPGKALKLQTADSYADQGNKQIKLILSL